MRRQMRLAPRCASVYHLGVLRVLIDKGLGPRAGIVQWFQRADWAQRGAVYTSQLLSRSRWSI